MDAAMTDTRRPKSAADFQNSNRPMHHRDQRITEDDA
jgi:hypothetical protein